MQIKNSNLNDISEILRLYQLAREFQKIKFPSNQWAFFDTEFIANEIAEHRQFKLIIDDKIACVWVITESDPQIWENSADETAIYIHRIATNPEFRGNNLVQIVVDWAKQYAKNHQKQFIRLDTCGENDGLIKHYQNCGFDFLGIKKLENTADLPEHYQNADVCFFEINLV